MMARSAWSGCGLTAEPDGRILVGVDSFLCPARLSELPRSHDIDESLLRSLLTETRDGKYYADRVVRVRGFASPSNTRRAACARAPRSSLRSRARKANMTTRHNRSACASMSQKRPCQKTSGAASSSWFARDTTGTRTGISIVHSVVAMHGWIDRQASSKDLSALIPAHTLLPSPYDESDQPKRACALRRLGDRSRKRGGSRRRRETTRKSVERSITRAARRGSSPVSSQ